MDLCLFNDLVECIQEDEPGFLSEEFVKWFNEHDTGERTPESIQEEGKYLEDFNKLLFFSSIYYKEWEKESEWIQEVFSFFGKYCIYDFIKHIDITNASDNQIYAAKILSKDINIFDSSKPDRNKEVVNVLDILQRIL